MKTGKNPSLEREREFYCVQMRVDSDGIGGGGRRGGGGRERGGGRQEVAREREKPESAKMRTMEK